MSGFNKINKFVLAIIILSLWAWTAFSLSSKRVIVRVEETGIRAVQPSILEGWGEAHLLLDSAKKIWLTDWPLFWWLMLPFVPLAGLGWLATNVHKQE